MARSSSDMPPAPASPSVAVPIGASGLRGRIVGVTRIGARAGLVVTACLAVLVLAIVYGVSTSGAHRSDAAVMPVPQVLPTSDDTFANIPGAQPTGIPAQALHTAQWRSATPAQPGARHPAGPPILPQPPSQNALQGGPAVPEIGSMPPGAMVRMPAPIATADPAIALRVERERQKAALALAARQSAIIVHGPSDAPALSPPVNAAAGSAAVPATAAATSTAPTTADQTYDPNVYAQKAKTDFLNQQKTTNANDYLAAPRQAAISPYEVQAGSIIPATLITGVNSDLPGSMIAQVSQDVYDSKTGAYLLIPAGSKIVGKYDAQVTNGQNRVLVAWQRIIFPDSSFINIDGMGGSDTAGYSGLTGKVDDHSAKLFRNAILFSLIGAGATLLQPRTVATIATGGVAAMVAAPSVGAQVAGQVGTQVSQVAQQATRQGLQQQPTIEVRPGYLFNVMVDRDLVLPGPYS